MKVSVTLTIDIPKDELRWLDVREATPREEVRVRVLNDVQELYWIQEVKATVTLK